MSANQIICGDCLKVLPTLPKARMVFADPVDNLGAKYNGFKDKQRTVTYRNWLCDVLGECLRQSDIFWLSCYYAYMPWVYMWLHGWEGHCHGMLHSRLFLWRYTFGQHQDTDCGNGYRPIFRMHWGDVEWNTKAIRIQSQRQRRGDKRAKEGGRVPDDVWEFPRVCGTFKERRKWHPNQHPEALVERAITMSCRPGDTVVDAFAGTGTLNRVCKRLGINCTGIELSRFYCEKIAEETGALLSVLKDAQQETP